MEMAFNLCLALSVGVTFGVIAKGTLRMVRKKEYTEKEREQGRRLWKTASCIMKYVTLLFLLLGFVWCVYFLILGVLSPAQAEYANNMSGLIASVLTIVSIAFAFLEFVKRK